MQMEKKFDTADKRSSRSPRDRINGSKPVSSKAPGTTTIWAQCYKTFFVRNLRIFVISQSVCTWQAFQPSLMFVGEARSLPQSGAPERCSICPVCSCVCSPYAPVCPGLARKPCGAPESYSTLKWTTGPYLHQTRLERLGSDKHFSLLRTFVNYGRKKVL